MKHNIGVPITWEDDFCANIPACMKKLEEVGYRGPGSSSVRSRASSRSRIFARAEICFARSKKHCKQQNRKGGRTPPFSLCVLGAFFKALPLFCRIVLSFFNFMLA